MAPLTLLYLLVGAYVVGVIALGGLAAAFLMVLMDVLGGEE